MRKLNRRAALRRRTRGTDVEVELKLDGAGGSEITTHFECLDNLLMMMAGHGSMDLRLAQRVNQHADPSYAIDDLAMALAEAIRRCLGSRPRIRQFGSEILPVGDALVLVAVDLVSPPVFDLDATFRGKMIEDLPVDLLLGFLDKFVDRLGASVHVKMLSGTHDVNMARAIFLALGRAIAMAAEPADRSGAREVAADIDYFEVGRRTDGDSGSDTATEFEDLGDVDDDVDDDDDDVETDADADDDDSDDAVDDDDEMAVAGRQRRHPGPRRGRGTVDDAASGERVARAEDERDAADGLRGKRRRGRRGGRGRRRGEGEPEGRAGRMPSDRTTESVAARETTTAAAHDRPVRAGAGRERREDFELELEATLSPAHDDEARGADQDVDPGSGDDRRERERSGERRPRGRRRRGVNSRDGRDRESPASRDVEVHRAVTAPNGFGPGPSDAAGGAPGGPPADEESPRDGMRGGDRVEAWDPGTLSRATINHAAPADDDESADDRPGRRGDRRFRRDRDRRGGVGPSDSGERPPRVSDDSGADDVDATGADDRSGATEGVLDYVTSSPAAPSPSPGRAGRGGRRPVRAGRRRR